LRRQLDAQQNAEVGTLSEQLRAANRDMSMWKERAESAEKRVKVFERFTGKLRGIRDNLFAERRKGSGRAVRGFPSHEADDATDRLKAPVDNDGPEATEKGERASSRDSQTREDSGETETSRSCPQG